MFISESLPHAIIGSTLFMLKMIFVLIVALFALRAYMIGRDLKHFFFGTAFTLIFLGLISWIVSNYLILENILCGGCIGYEWFFKFFYAYMALTILGVGALGLIYIKHSNPYALGALSLIVVFASFISTLSYLLFTLTIGAIFAFITFKAFQHACISRKAQMTVIAFALLTISHLFTAAAYYGREYHIIGDAFGVIGYALLAFTLVWVLSR